MAAALAGLVHLIYMLYVAAIILRSLLPWFGVSPYHPAMRFLLQITEPLLAPLRRTLRPMAGGLDFTPWIALIVLYILEQLLRTLIFALF